jgi:hypothetical protein
MRTRKPKFLNYYTPYELEKRVAAKALRNFLLVEDYFRPSVYLDKLRQCIVRYKKKYGVKGDYNIHYLLTADKFEFFTVSHFAKIGVEGAKGTALQRIRDLTTKGLLYKYTTKGDIDKETYKQMFKKNETDFETRYAITEAGRIRVDEFYSWMTN